MIIQYCGAKNNKIRKNDEKKLYKQVNVVYN